jgi:hypothetical protein
MTHVPTLHRRNRTLNKVLKEAERALGEEPSEQNFAWLHRMCGRNFRPLRGPKHRLKVLELFRAGRQAGHKMGWCVAGWFRLKRKRRPFRSV